jgi:hypothetical protein
MCLTGSFLFSTPRTISARVVKRKSNVYEMRCHTCHAIHIDHFVAADVDWLLVVRAHQPQHTLHGIVDKAEAARLLAVAPHLKLLLTGNCLAAEGSWSLLASALPGAMRSVNVVEASDAEMQRGEVLTVVPARMNKGPV